MKQSLPLQNKKVLIVDDDIDYLFQKKTELSAEGLSVITADRRPEALRLLDNENPDIAIIDLMMDEMDAGFVLAYELKKRRPQLPVIMVTGVTAQTGIEFDHITSNEKEWIKADAVLTKPVRVEQLVKEMRRLLNV